MNDNKRVLDVQHTFMLAQRYKVNAAVVVACDLLFAQYGLDAVNYANDGKGLNSLGCEIVYDIFDIINKELIDASKDN